MLSGNTGETKEDRNVWITASCVLPIMFGGGSIEFGGDPRSSLSFSHTVSFQYDFLRKYNSTLLVVFVAIDISDTSTTSVPQATSVQFNGTDMEFFGAMNFDSDNQRFEVWKLLSPDIGTYTIEIVLNGTANVVGSSRNFHNVSLTDPITALATTSGTTDGGILETTSEIKTENAWAVRYMFYSQEEFAWIIPGYLDTLRSHASFFMPNTSWLTMHTTAGPLYVGEHICKWYNMPDNTEYAELSFVINPFVREYYPARKTIYTKEGRRVYETGECSQSYWAGGFPLTIFQYTAESGNPLSFSSGSKEDRPVHVCECCAEYTNGEPTVLSATATQYPGRAFIISGTIDEPVLLTFERFASISGMIQVGALTNTAGEFLKVSNVANTGWIKITPFVGVIIFDNRKNNAPAYMLELENDAPQMLGLNAVEVATNTWTFSGTVVDELPAGLGVSLSGPPGIQGASATVNSDGSWSVTVTVAAGTMGDVTATVTDWFGLSDSDTIAFPP